MNTLVGKTVATVTYADPWDDGVRITFTDGTTLHIRELMQAGQISVAVNDEAIDSDWHVALENE
jgi:hypothetical protein